MNKLTLLVYSAVALLIVSCATGPSIPIKKTSDDCLVLIHTTIVADKNASRSRVFHFSLSAGYPELEVPQDDDGFIMLGVTTPEVKILGIKSNVQATNEHGESTSVPLDIELPYEPGKVLVDDLTFTQKITKNVSTNTTWVNWNFVETTDADKKMLLERFSKVAGPKAASWR
jgi:hypothetical protein